MADGARGAQVLRMLALTSFIAMAAGPIMALGIAPPTTTAGPCKGPPPAIGAVLHGPVLHVIDGDTFCVALGATPDRWTPLRLASVRPHAPSIATRSEHGTLMAVAFAQNVTCRVVGAAEARTLAVCEMDGHSIADRLEDPAAIRAGQQWR